MSERWHLADARAIWIREFARPLATQVPLQCWVPEIGWTSFLPKRDTVRDVDGIGARVFPLQRGASRSSLALALEGKRLARRMSRHGAGGPLVLTTPHYHELAAAWDGPSIYYSTDMFRYCLGPTPWIESLERRMVAEATLLCPNSRRIADYFIHELGADPDRVLVVPNATRASNVLEAPLLEPMRLPDDAASLPRPIAGVIGNLGQNMDWEMLRDAVAKTPWLSWLFVGPTTERADGPSQNAARAELLAAGGRVRFVGWKHYSELASYARGLDVAILPYRKREPTFSGSSTRFYEHLAACRPMVATHGFEELLHKEPFLRLAVDAPAMVAQLEALRALDFRDGVEATRWKESHVNTWEERADRMVRGLERVK